MKPYSDYRDSGVAWLERVPAHWEVRRNGRLFVERVETGFPELPILEVSLKTGVRVRDMDNLKRKQIMSERDKYKRALKGDVAYNMMRMWQGAVGVAPVDGLVSPAYVVARPFAGTDSRYFSYLFRTSAYMAEVDGYSRGIVKDRNRLYWEDFKRMPSCVPPPDEQRRIADYLDAHGRLVQRFIRNRRRLIEVLNEQKQAIIDRLVTRGLNSSICLKPSGMDWLGEIPEHWQVKPLKRWVRINCRVLPETTDPDYQFMYVDIGAVGTGLLIEEPEQMQFRDAPSRARRILRCGDTIISTVRTYLKAVYFISDDVENWVASTGFAVLTPTREVLPEYLSQVVLSSAFVNNVTANSVGIAYPAIAETRLAAFHVAIPATVEEQSAIVDRFRIETREINQAIQRVQREINLIREYRARLISDVVTGKIDARTLALPRADDGETHVAPVEIETTNEELETETNLDEAELVEEVADAGD